MYIGGLQKTTLLDFPGRIACILFTRGCNFRCPYCYNEDLLPLPKKEEPRGMEEVRDFLERRGKLLDGICITGGEPLLQEDLPEDIREFRRKGLEIKLDTNGSQPSRLAPLLREHLLDYVALDIKAAPEKYDALTKCSGSWELVRETLSLLGKSGVPFECRTTLVPRFHGSEDIHAMGREVEGISRWALQRFRPGKTLDPELETARSFTSREMEEFSRIAAPYAEEILLRE